MRYEIPIAQFEGFIGTGFWVGHEFEFQGELMVVSSIGQAEVNASGERVIPIEVIRAASH